MKTKIIIFMLIFSFTPIAVFSAEAKFHGLKTGMKIEEIIKYLHLDKLLDYKKNEYSFNKNLTIKKMIDDGISQDELETICQLNDFKGKVFDKLYLDLTQDGALWRIAVSFRVPGDPLEKIALKESIEKYFSGYTVKEETVTSQYGTIYFYVITMIDEKISNLAIQKHVKSFLNQM